MAARRHHSGAAGTARDDLSLQFLWCSPIPTSPSMEGAPPAASPPPPHEWGGAPSAALPPPPHEWEGAPAAALPPPPHDWGGAATPSKPLHLWRRRLS